MVAPFIFLILISLILLWVENVARPNNPRLEIKIAITDRTRNKIFSFRSNAYDEFNESSKNSYVNGLEGSISRIIVSVLFRTSDMCRG